MVKPEGGAAGPVSSAFISIITVERKVSPHTIASISTHEKRQILYTHGHDTQLFIYLPDKRKNEHINKSEAYGASLIL